MKAHLRSMRKQLQFATPIRLGGAPLLTQSVMG
jgi:hypothetical protein